MKNKWFCKVSQLRRGAESGMACGLLVACVLLGAPGPVFADVPDWLRAAAQVSLPKYDDETDAVLLLDETRTSINDKGEYKSVRRLAYKILRPQGRHLESVMLWFDKETPITYLKAWSIPTTGKPYEVKEKDAVELSVYDALYSDVRQKALRIPAADPGNVIGYEVEQKARPYLLQTTWSFQDYHHPVRIARFVLELPSGWEYKDVWVNYARREPRSAGKNAWMWEVSDIPAVKPEPSMPAPKSFEGRMTVFFYPDDANVRAKVADNWGSVGRFYQQLTVGRRELTPEIKAKVQELTGSRTSTFDKMHALATFAQRDIRYVSIQIGIGGLQPHSAGAVFSSRYGDCKDKATLLSTMLREIGIDSYYVFIHTDRGYVGPEMAPSITFNHAILGIRAPADVPAERVPAVVQHPKLGTILFFDPTDHITPLGQLPSYLQANFGLLATDEGGELVQLPLLAPNINRLNRTAKLELSAAGTLSGEVREVRAGVPAVQRRAQLLQAEGADRKKVLEDFLGSFLEGFHLTGASVENLEQFDQDLVLQYRFVAQSYAKRAGNMLIVRPRVLGQKASSLLEGEERKHPVEFDSASTQSDVFEIKLPPGYKVEDLPQPVEMDLGFASYRSKVEVQGNVLHYRRDFVVKEVLVDKNRLEQLKKFYRTVAGDERSSLVLQSGSP